MRHIPLIAVVYTASALLAACSSTTASVAAAVASPSGSLQPCTSTLQAWLHGPGGGDLHSALIAGTAMGAALESGSRTRVTGAAQELNSAASRADNHLPPACADHGSAYQIAMHDWMTGASDARDGNLEETSSKIATGAHVIDAVTMLQRLSPVTAGGDPNRACCACARRNDGGSVNRARSGSVHGARGCSVHCPRGGSVHRPLSRSHPRCPHARRLLPA
jgi:hypothetical protein